MFQQVLLCFTGFCAGIIVAGGVSGLLIGLSIVPRYAGITHTANHIFLYEDMSLLGTVAGTIVTLFPVRIPLGPFSWLSAEYSFGIFLGGWILALAEIAKVFPVFARRLKLTQGLSLVIISIAAGKTFGSLFYYAMGWMINFTALPSSYERIFHMRNIDEKKYEQYVKQLTPTHSLPLNMAKAFLTGGLICLLGQVIINTAPGSRCGHFRRQNLVFCTSHPFKRHSHRVWDLPEDRQIRWCREPCSHYRFCQFGSSIRH